jgi:hypothetical protein
MATWNEKNKHCKCCTTISWNNRAKGLCVKCYPLVNKIEIVEKWNLKDKATLIGIEGFDNKLLNQIIKSKDFEKCKMEILRQLNNRLALYKNCFSPEKVTGMSIEILLDNYANLLLGDKGKKMFHGACNRYDRFNKKQIETIFMDLNLILANKRFELDLNRIFLQR